MPLTAAPIRVILADDHSIVLDGLRRLFESQPGFTVVASCADGDAALAAVRAPGADVLVLDLRMPGTGGMEVLRTMAAEHLACRSVLLTAALRDEDVADAVRLGARGIVLKEADPEALLESVRRVHAGEQCIDREMLARAQRLDERRRTTSHETDAHLTPRELEIVRMVAQGLRNKIIADKLAISEGTVKIHLHNIYEKFAVDGRLELVLLAQEKGLV